MYDSKDRAPAPNCHPGTRTKVIDMIMNWANGGSSANKMLWLRGPAGGGKSAIAQAIAERLSAQESLAASFFCRRGEGRREDAISVIQTIAYQMCTHTPSFQSYVGRLLGNNPSILDKSIQTQFTSLLLEPATKIPEDEAHPTIIVIDGLDECKDHKLQQELIKLFSNALQ